VTTDIVTTRDRLRWLQDAVTQVESAYNRLDSAVENIAAALANEQHDMTQSDNRLNARLVMVCQDTGALLMDMRERLSDMQSHVKLKTVDLNIEELVVGKRYQVTFRLDSQRQDHEFIMDYLGLGAYPSETMWDARPVAGTQHVRKSTIKFIRLVPQNTGIVVDRVIR